MLHVIIGWVQLICLTFCIGVIVCRLWFFTPSMEGAFSYRGNFRPGLWKLFCFGLALLIAGSVAGLIGRAVEMSGRPVSGIPPVLPLVLFKTHYGTVWCVRIGALILMALSAAVARYRDTRTFLVLMLFFAVVVSMTSSASGHGADTGDFSVPEMMDWLHLIAACLWGGGLMVLAVTALPDLTGRREMSAPLIAAVAGRFSALAGITVAMIGITALYNIWSYVGWSAQSWGASYGIIVIAKMALFFGLLNLGAFNRYVSLPLLQEWAGLQTGGKGIAGSLAAHFFARFQIDRAGVPTALRFKRLVRAEALLIALVLLLAATLRHEVPARHAAHMGHHNEMTPPQHETGKGMRMQ